MADDADRADEQIQRNLDAAIAAARATQATKQDHCADCGIPLLPHRMEYGRCVPCQMDREAQQRMRAVGV
jgi:predicted amidophosphoribosyltransferase